MEKREEEKLLSPVNPKEKRKKSDPMNAAACKGEREKEYRLSKRGWRESRDSHHLLKLLQEKKGGGRRRSPPLSWWGEKKRGRWTNEDGRPPLQGGGKKKRLLLLTLRRKRGGRERKEKMKKPSSFSSKRKKKKKKGCSEKEERSGMGSNSSPPPEKEKGSIPLLVGKREKGRGVRERGKKRETVKPIPFELREMEKREKRRCDQTLRKRGGGDGQGEEKAYNSEEEGAFYTWRGRKKGEKRNRKENFPTEKGNAGKKKEDWLKRTIRRANSFTFFSKKGGGEGGGGSN